MLDPEYLRLYRRYVKSMRAFDIALKKRREERARYWERRRTPAPERRPVGSPPGFRIEKKQVTRTGSSLKQQERRIYLGRILGWAKVIGVSPKLDDKPDPDTQFDVLAFFDKLDLKMYWRAKLHYEKCKREFFDYARRKSRDRKVSPPKQDFRKNFEMAKTHMQHSANLQLLGINDDAAHEASLRNWKLEIETACYKAWENYQNNPDSIEAKKDLLVVLAESQLVGNDESPIAKKIEDEIVSLVASKKLE